LNQKRLEEDLSRTGLLKTDGGERTGAASATISAHVEAFERDILARGNTAQHAQQQASHVRRLMRMAHIDRIDDIRRESVQAGLRRLLSPRCGPRTCNAARQAVIQFERYLVASNLVRAQVLGTLVRFKEDLDIRRQRRALSQEEVTWLLGSTEAARDRVSRTCGIPPADRAILYAVGLATGFRRSALLALNPRSFHVSPEIERPFVRLAASSDKGKKDRLQRIPAELAALLCKWLKTKSADAPVWTPRPHADLALRFRRDMERARLAWITAAPDDAEQQRREASDTLKPVFHDGVRLVHADFHSLRHSAITFVVRAAGLRVGQVWAGHSTPVLTARYAHVDQEDLDRALNGLPDFSTTACRRSGPAGA
jgi:site-specific recombinase XerD